MQVSPAEATHALLGHYKGAVGVVEWHNDELGAWREAKRINSDGGRVRVVPVVDGRLTPEHEVEKSVLFETYYNSLGI